MGLTGKDGAQTHPRSGVWPRDVPTLSALPVGTRIAYVFEQILAHLLIPLLPLLILLRARREPAHLHHLKDRLGLGGVRDRGAVWIYAASLGETRAASPLIERLRAQGFNILLTHQSPAGLAEGARLFGHDSGVAQSYIPLDLFWAVRIFLRRFKPAALVVMEIEIWPAMLVETTRGGIPMAMANGNLLERSMGTGRGARHHMMQLYKLFAIILTRTQDYVDRYIRVGVDPARAHVAGEMRFDQAIDPAQLAMAKTLRANMDGATRVLMIASSVEGEETELLDMVQGLLARDQSWRVIWAPRSPQRFEKIVQALKARDIRVVRRSDLGAAMNGPVGAARVIVGDSIGEMNAYYPAADLVFVGASLIDHGGHNIVEPLALGRPVVMGPSTFGIDFAAKPAAAAGAFESLPNAKALGARIGQLLDDSAALTAMSAAATRFMADKAGAADRTCAGVVSLLTKDAPTTRTKG